MNYNDANELAVEIGRRMYHYVVSVDVRRRHTRGWGIAITCLVTWEETWIDDAKDRQAISRILANYVARLELARKEKGYDLIPLISTLENTL